MPIPIPTETWGAANNEPPANSINGSNLFFMTSSPSRPNEMHAPCQRASHSKRAECAITPWFAATKRGGNEPLGRYSDGRFLICLGQRRLPEPYFLWKSCFRSGQNSRAKLLIAMAPTPAVPHFAIDPAVRYSSGLHRVPIAHEPYALAKRE